MSTIEERLADAYQAAAETVRPEAIPGPPDTSTALTRPRGSDRRRGSARLAVPLRGRRGRRRHRRGGHRGGAEGLVRPSGHARRLEHAAARYYAAAAYGHHAAGPTRWTL